MRIDIQAADRVGITQDILAILSNANCDLITTEMVQGHVFVNMNTGPLSFGQIKGRLFELIDVTKVLEIDLLPAEQKQKHLNVLMQRLPDPTFDIDSNGKILLATASAAKICQQNIEDLEGKNLADFIAEPLSILLGKELSTVEVNVLRQPFQAEITPVTNHEKLTGAILVLRSPQRLGQQLSALQKSNDTDINNIIGQSAAIKAVMAKTLRFGKLDLPVLICGETGTGKELLAQALHQQGFDSEDRKSVV